MNLSAQYPNVITNFYHVGSQECVRINTQNCFFSIKYFALAKDTYVSDMYPSYIVTKVRFSVSELCVQ